ncbi:MAG TPA: ATP-binding protein [Gammaproteobacteria bacterium]
MNQQNTQTQSTAGQQTDLLFGLIHVGPKLLHQFIGSSRTSLDSIKMQLNCAKTNGDYQTMIDSVLRTMHGIKGSASLFDLTLYIRITHEFEDKLRRLQGNDDEPRKILAEIDELIACMEHALAETALLLEPLSWFKNIADERISRTQAFLTGAALLVEELGRTHNVNATLHYSDFDLERMPADYSQDVVDILTQMIRNAVVHGIEPPNDRQESGKPVKGRICLGSRHDSQFYRFSVQDDGRGLNADDLKAAIAASATFSRRATDGMTTGDLAAFLFEPGFTTSRSASHSSGSGMGLNLVVQKLSSLGGRLEFAFTRGKGCRFDVILPVYVR